MAKKTKLSCPIVGIGASAGGLDALIRFISTIPSQQKYTFVVIQHLDASMPSQTAAILSRNTSIPVEDISDGREIEGNRIYVLPSNAVATVVNGKFKLQKRVATNRVQTIDTFFHSLTKLEICDVFAVILSGTGSDGTEGARAIKIKGGTVFAQDPATAKFDAMPLSAIDSGCVDFVLSPEEIAKELVRISAGGGSEKENGYMDPDGALQSIFHLLLLHTSIDFSTYKPSTIKRRIQRQMRRHAQENISAYVHYLENNPAAIKELADDMFIHVTEFFRNPDSFKALSTKVFPKLIKARKSGAPIRVWVPACSTGEEPYSIAIALLEYLESKKLNIPIQIFGTDISETAVQLARVGIYKSKQLKGISDKINKKYFEKTKDGYKIIKAIREVCIFSKHDITSNPPFAKIDLLSCRNLLIYFTPELQENVVPLFHYALNSDGILWLGRSEAPSGFTKFFSFIDKTHKIYSKINLASPPGFKFPKGLHLKRSLEISKGTASSLPTLDSQKVFDRIVMSRYAPAGVLINGDLDILQVRGHTGPFIELPAGAPDHNLLKMIRRELLVGVRHAIKAAIANNETIRKEGLSYIQGSDRNRVNIEVIPVNPQASLDERQYLVLFEGQSQIKKPVEAKKSTRRKYDESYIRELLQEIDAMREYQQSLTEGYESAQEDLTSANEELQSANEELQSANEEMETGREELQSANEELTTVNEELETRNAELIQLNEKLILSEERFRLLVTGVRDYAIFLLDPEGHVTSWNEGAKALKGYEESEILGKHFSVFYPEAARAIHFPESELVEAKRVGRFEDEGWRIRKDGTRFWANVIITRITDKNGRLIGFSKITRDLTERKEAEEQYRILVEGVKDYAIFRLDTDGTIKSWNEGAKHVKGYSSEEVLGKNLSIFYPEEDIKNGKPSYELEMTKKYGRFENEGWRIRKDGSRFWANSIFTSLTDSDGKLVGFSKITRDLTERKRMEDELRHARLDLEFRVEERTKELTRALGVRDEFLSVASHELKTPLTSLKLQIQMNKRAVSSGKGILNPESLMESYDLAIKQINSLTTLVEDLLDTSRIHTGNFTLSFEETNLSDLIEDVVDRSSTQLASAGCELHLDLEKNIIGEWDRQRLEQVILNLLTNAIKYASGTPIEISAKRVANGVLIAVQDNGPGIPKELHQKIFERFERAEVSKSIGGLGLGLYIVRRIIEDHSGKIWVESELGEGARFLVELPLSQNIGNKK